MAHAIFDSAQGASVSFDSPSGSDMVELQSKPLRLLLFSCRPLSAQLPDPARWSDADAQRWANELRVSCVALAIALKEAKLI